MTDESNSKHQPAAQPAHNHEREPEQKSISPGVAVTGAVIVVLIFAALAIFGILSRKHHDDVLAKSTTAAAAPSVIALPPKTAAPVDSFLLPGSVTAFTDSPISARPSGHLTHWYFDIGARVRKGALLADIATP